MVAVQMQDDLRRVLDDEGKVLPGAKVPTLSEEMLGRMFDTHLVLCYLDKAEWYDVHPLLRDEVARQAPPAGERADPGA